jgi:hypothetical protein
VGLVGCAVGDAGWDAGEVAGVVICFAPNWDALNEPPPGTFEDAAGEAVGVINLAPKEAGLNAGVAGAMLDIIVRGKPRLS